MASERKSFEMPKTYFGLHQKDLIFYLGVVVVLTAILLTIIQAVSDLLWVLVAAGIMCFLSYFAARGMTLDRIKLIKKLTEQDEKEQVEKDQMREVFHRFIEDHYPVSILVESIEVEGFENSWEATFPNQYGIRELIFYRDGVFYTERERES